MSEKSVVKECEVREDIPSSLLLELYAKMLRIRLFNERQAEEAKRGNIFGYVHLYTGQEAVAVGVVTALEKGDRVTSTHRAEGHLIAAGAPLKSIMAEAFGRTTGLCEGKAGPMGYVARDYGVIGAYEVVGTGIPIATGLALAFKMTGSTQVAVSFFGDGAVNQGVLYESMNMAALWRLPVIFVCENNGYAVDTSIKRAFPVEDLAARTTGFGLPGVVVDGTDVIEVYVAAKEAVKRARAGKGPTFIEARALRWCGHYVADPQWYYRTREEVEDCKKNDPIEGLRGVLRERSLLSPADDRELRETIESEIEEAVRFAQDSPWPGEKDFYTHLYAESGVR